MRSLADVRSVLVGVSGGVDSAVALHRLKDGAEVRAAMVDLCGAHDERGCRRSEAWRRARDAAATAGAPFEVLDDREGFARTVVEPFVAAYLSGETPNPCAACNRRRFALLARRAAEQGVATVASGHYARLVRHRGRPYVARAADRAKDQSYMLWMLGEETLARLALPLGEMTKREVRGIARTLGLEAAEAPESQEVCFAPDGYRRFLAAHGVEPRRGRFVDRCGGEVGEHDGHWLFTIGQRRGIAVPGGPWYVLERRATANEVVIGRADELLERRVLLRDVIDRGIEEDAALGDAHGGGRGAGDTDADGRADDDALLVQFRYRSPAVPVCDLGRRPDGRLLVELETPCAGLAPGQSAVFYRGDRVVGGGVLAAAATASDIRGPSGDGLAEGV